MSTKLLLLVVCVATLCPAPITSLGSQCGGKELTRSSQQEYWLAALKHDGNSPFNDNPGYKVWRNVKDYGAKGDGQHDDTDAIMRAQSDGGRCGQGCKGTPTTTPALVYFPPGQYIVSKTIVQYYYTLFVGDAVNRPRIIFSSNFNGAVGFDANPYNQWTVQCNFFRGIHNLIIDSGRVSPNHGITLVSWQVSQATSMANVMLAMSTAAGNQHTGVRINGGSGGYMGELEFNGGKFALDVGNQQFTTRNITINNCGTAIHLSWDWGWTFKGVRINKCGTGLDMGGSSSVLLMDAHISNTPVGVKANGKSLILDNVHLDNVQRAVEHNGQTLLQGGTKLISSWGEGNFYSQNGAHNHKQGDLKAPTKPDVLLDGQGNFFEKAKPTYADVAVGDVIDIKSEGAHGDGKQDDTHAIQQALDKYAGCKVIYFPHGTYKVTDTILVPAGTRIIGEVWSVISASGGKFQDMNNPIPMFKIGNPGDTGVAEISDIIFSTIGPVPGAILVQINMHDPANEKGAVAIWNTHFRIGGAKGTQLQGYNCGGLKGGTHSCIGAHTMLHITTTGSAYLENIWAWLADHGLDQGSQLSIYNGRGILSESKSGPVWMYGTASEHNVLYQYNIVNSKNLIMALIQTETAYYQPSPPAPKPFFSDPKFHDPDYSHCAANSHSCAMGYGLRIAQSEDIFVYGAGLYNFFQSLGGNCVGSRHCQDYMVSVEKSPSNVYIYQLNTVGSDVMVRVDGQSRVRQQDNNNGFCNTIAGLY